MTINGLREFVTRWEKRVRNMFYTGRLSTEVQSLAFYALFFTEKVLEYLILTNGTPFKYPVKNAASLLTCFNCCKCTLF